MRITHFLRAGLVATAIAALFVSSVTAKSQDRRSASIYCSPRDAAISRLGIALNQFPLVQGVTYAAQFAELYADSDGNWTFAVTVGLETCIVATGTDLQTSVPTRKDPAS